MRAAEAVDAHVACFEYQIRARRNARLDEIPGDFGLTVNRDGAARETLQVDAKGIPCEPDGEPLVDQALAQQPPADLRLHQQVDGPLLQDAGANAAGDIFAALTFENDAVDAMLVQQL